MASLSDPPAQKAAELRGYEFVERLEWYQPGGYHPILLGDVFCDRYKVIHKLGWGSYSVVWLARDLEHNRNVALKVTVANESRNSCEARILHALDQGDKDHPGREFVSQLLDEFWIDGPNGRHLCLVLRPTGVSVADSLQDCDLFPLNVARSLAAQALLGLEYIHSCGVAHGDIHLGNLLYQRPELEHFTEAEVVDHLGEPERLPVLRDEKQSHGPELPKYCVGLGMIGMCSEDAPANTKIVISDFGQSFFATEHCEALQTPRNVAPPEHFFKGHLGPPADVWTVGMSIYSMLTSSSLIESMFNHPDEVIADMIEVLGRPPTPWWENWGDRIKWYNDKGERIDQCGLSRPLSKRLEERSRGGKIGDDERRSLEELLRGEFSEDGTTLSHGLLEYEPSKRLTASEAVASNWMVRWAWPDLVRGAASEGKYPRFPRPEDFNAQHYDVSSDQEHDHEAVSVAAGDVAECQQAAAPLGNLDTDGAAQPDLEGSAAKNEEDMAPQGSNTRSQEPHTSSLAQENDGADAARSTLDKDEPALSDTDNAQRVLP